MSEVALAGVRGFRQVDEVVRELPAAARADMRVPARVFADRELIGQIAADRSLEQLQNVATLPGITGAALAMPDIHQGYGFPVGGAAATEPPDGVVSPGGRRLRHQLRRAPAGAAADRASSSGAASRRSCTRSPGACPSGAGHGGALKLKGPAFDRVLVHGPRILAGRARHRHRGGPRAHRVRRAALPGADPATVSERARVRGAISSARSARATTSSRCSASRGSSISAAAEVFGLRAGQVTVLIHSGSRGFGHQVCSDYVRMMDAVQARYRITLPDRQLACAPLSSPEGSGIWRRWRAPRTSPGPTARCSRTAVARVGRAILGPRVAEGTRQVYDVAHNVAKLERHGGRELCVHRKGATRAFPAGSTEIPSAYREVGQPVFIPGSMGTIELRARRAARGRWSARSARPATAPAGG